MSPLVLEKPVFTKDQVVSATEASKSLSAIRKLRKTLRLSSLLIIMISIP